MSQATDEQLSELMSGPMRDQILNEIFRRMEEHFRADAARDTEAVIWWRIDGRPGGGHDDYETVISNGTCKVSEGRSADSFGAVFFYNDISNDLQDTLEPVLPIRNEQGVELYYNWAPVGWSRITADLQVIGPYQLRSETRLFFGVRWKVMF